MDNKDVCQFCKEEFEFDEILHVYMYHDGINGEVDICEKCLYEVLDDEVCKVFSAVI